MGNAKTVTDQEFKSQVLDSSEPVLVDIWADWCGPCKALAPTIEELATDFAGKVKVMKLDADANPTTPAQYGVRGIPTVLVFKGGQVVETLVGKQAKETYISALNKHL